VLRHDVSEVIKTADFLSFMCLTLKKPRGSWQRAVGHDETTAFLINTSRGEIVQEAALVDALNRGAIAGAGWTCSRKSLLTPKTPFSVFKM